MDTPRDMKQRLVKSGRSTGTIWHLVVLAMACLALVQGSAAFAIKYHFDLTEQALHEERFDHNPIGLVQTYNWMNDMAETVNQGEDFQGWALKTFVWHRNQGGTDFEQIGSDFCTDYADKRMQFDQLKDYANVSAEWMRLESRTYDAVRYAEDHDDVEGFLAVMGMSLHTVQDFYAHGNWVERDWNGDATWFDVPESWKREGEIYTHTSGERDHSVINKDYTTRPDFEPAYRDAFYASLQWTELLRSWVRPEFWEKARMFEYTTSNGYRFSNAVMRANWYGGTWNSQTGAPSFWTDSETWEILNMEIGKDQIPQSTYNRFCSYVRFVGSPNSTPTKHPQEYAYIPEHDWLKISTERIRQTDRDGNDIDPGIVGGKADYYTKILVNDQSYYEDPVKNDDDISPEGWITLIPLRTDLGAEVVDIDYSVWDDDGVGRGDNDLADINPEYDEESWTYTGPVWDVRDLTVDTDGFRGCIKWGSCKIKCWGCYKSKGDGNEARALFHISREPHARSTSRYTPEKPLPKNSPPSAYFILSTESGYPPFPLTITDASTGNPTAWSWTFTGPIDVGTQPITTRTIPTYTLNQPGMVKISLTVSNAYGSSSVSKTVTVTGSAPVADFYMSPAFGTEPLDVTIYDTSIGTPATWEWTIESPDRAPQKVYQKELPGSFQFGAGTHRVTLTVGNAFGSTSRTRTVMVLPADTAEPPVTCPAGCSCTEADAPGVERCSDTPCGSLGGKTYYCSRPIPFATCSGTCRCLLESDAIQIFGDDNHVPQKCSTSPCESAGGISKYCYREGTVSCPGGCRCLNPVAASYQFITPIKCSDTVCGYSGDPDVHEVRDPKYCYREGHVVS